ncbi:MAG: acyltransferase [Betaproteobacteria bacterium]|nr:MAG: acyltransferase [Betaproteobacteria bacterium]
MGRFADALGLFSGAGRGCGTTLVGWQENISELALTRSPHSDDRNTGLDLLRALAIVLTFFVHFLWIIGAWVYQRDFESLSIRDAKGFLEGVVIWLYHSQHGVFLFFVLSGFLMGRKWFSAHPPAVGTYLRDRAWRTLPGAWLAVTAALGLMYLAGRVPSEPLRLWVENLFFLNWFRKIDTEHVLVVTWSLHAEWLFYLALPVVAWVARRWGKSHWIVVAIASVALAGAVKFLSVRGAAYVLFFAAGVIAAIEQKRLRGAVDSIPWIVVLLLYIGVNGVYGWFSPTAAKLQTALWNPFDTHAIAFAFTATLLLLKIVDAPFGQGRWVRLGRYIGKISYSVYLWHLLVLLALGHWLGWPSALAAQPSVGAVGFYATSCVLLTWAVSALSFRWIEQPYFARRERQKIRNAS